MFLSEGNSRGGGAHAERYAYVPAPARTSYAHRLRCGRKPSAVRCNPATHYSYSRPQSSPLIAVRDAGRKYRSPKRPPGPEAILHAAWRNAGLERAEVRGRDGRTYRVVYGGRPGGSLGPDFTDAVVERDDGVVFRGDIEIHVRESDWRAHGHHTDPRYNGVVLHVVAAGSEGRPAVKATGASIPLLALNWKNPATPGPAIPGLSPHRQRKGPTGGEAKFFDSDAPGPGPGSAATRYSEPPNAQPGPLGTLDLATAGLERFHAQAAGIALDIGAFGADQAIWLGIMGALGYPRNRRAFRTLATRVPWSAAAMCEDPHELESLLLRAAGFSAGSGANSGNRPENPVNAVRTSGAAAPSAGAGAPPAWVRPWGRPANSPVARIRAISALVPEWASQNGIASTCSRWVASVERPTGLSAMFRPAELAGDADVSVIGIARAAEIVVNVLLPATMALATSGQAGRGRGTRSDDLSLKNRVLALYDAHPVLAENSLTKEAHIALGVDYLIPKISSARDQQGLVALYREMFRRGVRPRQTRLPGI